MHLIKGFCALLGGSYKNKLSESYDINCMKEVFSCIFVFSQEAHSTARISFKFLILF